MGGGTQVVVSGSGFADASAVNFGSNSATDVTLNSNTQITVVSPPGSDAVAITVTTPGGASATSAAAQFLYAPVPKVNSVQPVQGLTTGRTSVTVIGSGFNGASMVEFGSRSAEFTRDSDTQITAVTPPGTGAVPVRVTTPGGISSIHSGAQFTYVTST